MTPKISTVDLNNNPEIDVPVATAEVHEEEPATTPPTETPGTGGDDIDTDELEALLVDLKETKKRNKAPPKKRTRKPKVATPEPELVEEAPVVVEPVLIPEPEPIVEAEQKPKRKYVRKPHVVPETPPLSAPQAPVEESVKQNPRGMIEEMQRAERALRYQMRKNKMQTLVSQAF